MIAFCFGILLTGVGEAGQPVKPPTAALVAKFNLSPSHQKAVLLQGLPILSSRKTKDQALLEAHWILSRMMEGRDDIVQAIALKKIRVVVMAYDERTLDTPEHADLTPASYWNSRARGLGATLSRPATSCGEENLLEMPGDPYRGENILIHEFGHTVHEIGMARIDPTFDGRLKKVFDTAMAEGKWKGTYAATNHKEYWAEGVQAWFDCNDTRNLVVTRVELQKADVGLSGMLKEVFGDKPWRYIPPSKRPAIDRAHLLGFDPVNAPTFRWEKP